MIKTFEEFNNTPVEEGLFGAFKARNQIIKVQGLVVDECERLIQENPKRFTNAKSVLKAVEQFAYKAYKKIVTEEVALTFSQWWEEFEESQIRFLDRTVFNIK
jgi:hypothetical protein